MRTTSSLLFLVTVFLLSSCQENEAENTTPAEEIQEASIVIASCTITTPYPIKYSDLLITGGGEVTLSSDNEYDMSIADPRSRATVDRHGLSSRYGGLVFRYNGPSDEDIPLGSGTLRRQIGLKLRSGDPCNLLYAMWRIEPAETMVVQMKHNPGMTTSEECGNNGYTTIVPDETPHPFPPVSSVTDGEYHTLFAQFDPVTDANDSTPGNDFRLTICADGHEIWVKNLYDLPKEIAGTSGFRTDNGNFDFRFFSDVSKDGIYWLAAYGGAGEWMPLRFSDVSTRDMALGDFDGDGKTDAFVTSEGKWYISSACKSDLAEWNASTFTLNNLRFGDFDGDGKSDVFRISNAGEWYISSGGDTKWTEWFVPEVQYDTLAFGDFDGDGKTDVFTTSGGKWLVSPGASAPWQEWNTSVLELKDLRFGDFDGDGKSDVLRYSGGKSYVSPGGSSKWQEWNSLELALDQIHFGDFDGDGKTDLLKVSANSWYISREGKSDWILQGTSADSIGSVLVGDFNGDGQADLLRTTSN